MSSQSVLRTVIQPKTTVPPVPRADELIPESDPSASIDVQSENLEAHLALLVENAPVALSLFDDEMRYLVANRIWIEEFGLQQVQPLLGKSQYEIFPGLHPGWRQVYDRALQGHVVRSEHDAISGQDGKPIVYRWEVRPWRRKTDASVGGLMVICEKFSTSMAPVQTVREETSGPTPREGPEVANLLFNSALPIVALNSQGIILQANQAAVGVSLSRGIRGGASFFWDAFGEGKEHISLRDQTLESIERLAKEPTLAVLSLTTRTSVGTDNDIGTQHALSARWVLSRTFTEGTHEKFIAVAVLGGSPFEVATQKEVSPPALSTQEAASASPSSALLHELQEKLNRTRQEVTVLREAEQAFAKREGRQRAVLESLSCGLLVLDERGTPIYNNDHIARLLGRGIQRGETVEQWLMQACPTDEHKQSVARIWAQDVWSRQLTKIISLITSDGLLKELEFRPITLSGGGVLVSIHDITDQCRTEESLRSTEAKFKVMLQEAPVGVLLVDKAGAVFEANAIAEKMLGRSKAELRRMSIDEWLSPESAAARKEALRQMRGEGRRSVALDVQLRAADDSLSPANLRVAVVSDEDGQPHCTIHFLESVTDTSDRPPLTPPPVSLPLSNEAPFRHTEPVQATQTRITVRWLLQTDLSGHIANWSTDAKEVFGFEATEAVGNRLHGLFRPSDPTGYYSDLQLRAATPEEAVTWGFFGKEGVRGSGRFFVKSAGDGGMAIDLYEEHQTQEVVPHESESSSTPKVRTYLVKPSQLWPVADLDREKLLLSETHHRIKNHLQIISSMLNLQLNALTDQGARAALRSSQNRVRSIAALHQHLYQLALGEGPGFDEFARGLSQRLRECYEVPEEQVGLRLQIDGGQLQQEWMMPLALILNETLSNAFEHAFPASRRGTVTVRLELNDGVGEFDVSDDGVGLPDGFEPVIAPGLGLKILGVFADQMRGELRLSGAPEGGTKFNLRFPMASVDN